MKKSQTIRDIIDLTKRLAAIPSVKNDKASLRKVIAVAKKELRGFQIKEFEKDGIPSILVSNGKEKKHFKIILNAHLDVIHDTPEHFAPIEKAGKLYGRGTYDMKGAAAAYIVLFKELAQKLPFPLALQFVTDEEYSGQYGTGHQINSGVRGEFVIIGEAGSRLHIKNAAKGHIGLKLQTSGIASHGAYPWEGENAILYMHETIDKIRKAFPTPKNAAWKSTVTISRIESTNQVHNRVPSDCTAYLDIRFTPQDQSTILAKIEKIVHKKVKTEVVWLVDPHYTDPKNRFIKQLCTSTKKVIGKTPKLIAAHGASDARLYSAVNNAVIEFGPEGHGHHADNEWLDITSLENYYHILKHFLLSLAEEKLIEKPKRTDVGETAGRPQLYMGKD